MMIEHYKINKLMDKNIKKKIKDEKILCIKIYILGTGYRKEYVINTLFRNEITDNYLKNIANKEFKTDQFHWIARIYNDELTEQKCKEIRQEIKEDKSSNKNKISKYQVILSFGNDTTKILSKHFFDFSYSR